MPSPERIAVRMAVLTLRSQNPEMPLRQIAKQMAIGESTVRHICKRWAGCSTTDAIEDKPRSGRPSKKSHRWKRSVQYFESIVFTDCSQGSSAAQPKESKKVIAMVTGPNATLGSPRGNHKIKQINRFCRFADPICQQLCNNSHLPQKDGDLQQTVHKRSVDFFLFFPFLDGVRAVGKPMLTSLQTLKRYNFAKLHRAFPWNKVGASQNIPFLNFTL